VIRKARGFSLIEMAIVLIIIGLISGITLPAIKVMLDWQKARTTAIHQDQIFYALASYANKNGFLPYAANPINQDGVQEKGRRRGILPFADLGLPESIGKDGYQRWFTYVVDDFYGNSPKRAMENPLFEALGNTLCRDHEKQNAVTIKGVPEKIAVVLISHGHQGRGAFPNPSINPPQGVDEQQNSVSDQELIDRPVSQDPANPFSHKVIWVTARNLMAIYAHAPCPPKNEAKPQSENMMFQIPRGTKKGETHGVK
jgi:prepilin-type N-terminal cleavage/methylation domain-containing protein